MARVMAPLVTEGLFFAAIQFVKWMLAAQGPDDLKFVARLKTGGGNLETTITLCRRGETFSWGDPSS
jgi:hypothetical protein